MLSEVKSFVIVHICYEEHFTKCDHNEEKKDFVFWGGRTAKESDCELTDHRPNFLFFFLFLTTVTIIEIS